MFPLVLGSMEMAEVQMRVDFGFFWGVVIGGDIKIRCSYVGSVEKEAGWRNLIVFVRFLCYACIYFCLFKSVVRLGVTLSYLSVSSMA